MDPALEDVELFLKGEVVLFRFSKVEIFIGLKLCPDMILDNNLIIISFVFAIVIKYYLIQKNYLVHFLLMCVTQISFHSSKNNQLNK